MIELTFGRPGECKSLDQARVIEKLLKRALKCKKKYKLNRKVFVNLHMTVTEELKPFLFYYSDLFALIRETDCDIVIDEVSVFLPCDKWKDTHFEIRRMLAQHRKRGIEIYANTQDYRMVDINFRRMIHNAFIVRKGLGNRNPSSTLPPIKHIWGFYLKRDLDPAILEDLGSKVFISLPSFHLIRRKYVNMYDTREDIKPGTPPPFHHQVRRCPECGFRKVIHS